jgi:nitroreductase
MMKMDLLKALNWRYATKKMDPTKTVPEEKVQRILEAIRLTATSSGLQPYEIIVVTNPEVRAKMQAAASNQAQITEGSHVLVFAAWNDYTADRINMMFDYNNEVRGFVNEGAENYRKMLLQNYPSKGAEVNFQHAAKQAYIALGTAMIAAAEQEVDATPMEGFNPAAVDEILGLTARGLRSTVLLPLGYREADKDWLVNMKKVRRTNENFITEVK